MSPVHKDKDLREATLRREGIEGLGANNDESRPQDESKFAKDKRVKRTAGGADDVGKALRSAYDEALRENVPDDFLDLLGKLS